MRDYYPLLVIGAAVSVFAVAFIIAYALMKDKKEAIGFDRNMKDSDIIKRLLGYAKPYKKEFAAVFALMVFSIAYDIVSPLLVGNITGIIKESFEMRELVSTILIYAGVLDLHLLRLHARNAQCI